MLLRTLCLCAVAIVAVEAYYDDYYDDSTYQNDNSYDMDYSSSDLGYSPSSGYDDYYNYPSTDNYHGLRNRGDKDRHGYRYKSMGAYAKSYGSPTKKEFVPVIIKKKKNKKKKILTTHHGFFIPGGTQMFGKFKDVHSCQKACEITPTCFAGDFNPWIGKCFLHSNLTACAAMRSHKAITHFKKVPCSIVETSRGYITLGASVIAGIEIKGIDTLQDCIKKCATAGGGIAPTNAMAETNPQICCNLDYDFATHKCFFHLCINAALLEEQYCAAVPQAPLNSIVNPSTISITLCPLVA